MCRTMPLLKLYHFTRSKEFAHNYQNWGLLPAGQEMYQRQETSNRTYTACSSRSQGRAGGLLTGHPAVFSPVSAQLLKRAPDADC